MGRRQLVVMVVAAVALVAGCGSGDAESTTATTPEAEVTEPAPSAPTSDETTAPPAPVDVCGLLADVDVEALLGEAPGEPAGDRDVLGDTCAVDPADGSSTAALRLVVSEGQGVEAYASQRETFGVDGEVDGLGDEAFHSGPYLFVLRGDTLVFVQVLRDAATGSPAVEDAELEGVMTTVLAALDG